MGEEGVSGAVSLCPGWLWGSSRARARGTRFGALGPKAGGVGVDVRSGG